MHGHAAVDGITVHTNANGRLTGLDISARAHALGPLALTELIMRVYNQTADDVQTRATAILAELRDDPAVARIADATVPLRQTAEPQPQPVQPPLPRANRPLYDDDDIDSYSQPKSWLV